MASGPKFPIQAFFIPCSQPSFCSSCSTFQILYSKDSQPPPYDSDISSFDPAYHPPPPYDPLHATSSPTNLQSSSPPPSASSLHPNPNPDPHSIFSLPHTWSQTQPPVSKDIPQLAPLLPLQEVAGTEGTVWVHVPFSMSNLSQIERLGSSSHPSIKEFEFPTLRNLNISLSPMTLSGTASISSYPLILHPLPQSKGKGLVSHSGPC